MLDHLDDLESDFSVFHRVDDIYAMDGPQFFSRAYRLSAYQGVMAIRAQAGEQTVKVGSGVQPGEEVVPSTRSELTSNAAFKGLVTFGGSDG